MAIAEDEITALLMEIVVMFTPRRTAPFGGSGVGPRVPLRVNVATTLRFKARQVHQDVMFLNEHGSAGIAHFIQPLVQNQLTDDQIGATEGVGGVGLFMGWAPGQI